MMQPIGDHPELLAQLGAIQRDLVAQTHRLARAAGVLDRLPHARNFDETLAFISRAICEHLGFERAFAYVAQGEAIAQRSSWPLQRVRAAGWPVRQAIATNLPSASRAGRTVVVPLELPGLRGTSAQGETARGALRLEGRARSAGDAIAGIMSFAGPVALALENAALAERSRSQGARVETLASRLSEANHRIKNNLQALAGFLAEHEREAAASADGRSHAFYAGIGRIQAMAALHEALLCAEDEAVDLAALTRRVCADTATVDQVDDRVAVVVDAQPLRVGPEACRAYAMALHELVSNALHHAYPDGRRGQVRVRLRREDGFAALEVADDGVGLPQPAAAQSGFGLRITTALAVNDLRGTLELANGDRGTIARLRFPLADSA